MEVQLAEVQSAQVFAGAALERKELSHQRVVLFAENLRRAAHFQVRLGIDRAQEASSTVI